MGPRLPDIIAQLKKEKKTLTINDEFLIYQSCQCKILQLLMPYFGDVQASADTVQPAINIKPI
jgi:hypothetical protein